MFVDLLEALLGRLVVLFGWLGRLGRLGRLGMTGHSITI
jgi:hypothetical protein